MTAPELAPVVMPLRIPENLHVEVRPDYESLSQGAADLLGAELQRKPDALLGLATGASPARTYALLAQRRTTDPDLLARVRVLKTDEWGGLAMDDPGSSEAFLQRCVVGPWGISAGRYAGWDSRPADPAAEAARIREWLARNGPLDLCVLGVGLNGHLLLNEPADFLQPHAHVAELAGESLGHAMLKASANTPRFGLTIGMADILQSRHAFLLVSGAAKAEPLARFFEGRVTPRLPVSLLWLHPNLTVFCDHAALGMS